MRQPAVAFFDLDRTLLCRNSALLWIRRELALGRLTYRQAVRALGWLMRYGLGFSDQESTLREAIATLRGSPERELRARIADFYAQVVRRLYRPGAHKAIEHHRQRGDALVLLTSASSYLAELAQDELAFDAALCNRFEVDDSGLFTGRPKGPLCYGHGKVDVALSYTRAHGHCLEDCTFYSDSASDLPMLQTVGAPVAVNPDVRLWWLARRYRWASENWGKPPH